MKLRIKLRRDGAQVPTYAREGDAGADLRLWGTPGGSIRIAAGETKKLATGIALEIPDGYEVQVRGRSGLSSQGLLVHTGTVDSGYRGEICVLVTNVNQAQSSNIFNGAAFESAFPSTGRSITLSAGDRIAQMVLAPVVRAEFEVAEELGETERGAGGFGHTGRA